MPTALNLLSYLHLKGSFCQVSGTKLSDPAVFKTDRKNKFWKQQIITNNRKIIKEITKSWNKWTMANNQAKNYISNNESKNNTKINEFKCQANNKQMNKV